MYSDGIKAKMTLTHDGPKLKIHERDRREKVPEKEMKME